MIEPGRTFATTSAYRYGFNRKEQDSILGGGTGIDYNYGARIYDARVQRFLSSDPVTKKYPMLTPYQFCSNRPVDGVDIDGKEYGTIHMTINSSTGSKSSYYSPYDESQANINGPEGAGVDYDITSFHTDANGATIIDGKSSYFIARQNKFSLLGITIVKKDYGNYMGATPLLDVTKSGDLINNTASYYASPVDAVDAAAETHDREYDNLHAAGSNSLFNDWGTTAADEKAAGKWLDFFKNNFNKVGQPDPIVKGANVTNDELQAASNAISLFQIVIWNKKEGIKSFMIDNYFDQTKGKSKEQIYQFFFKTYMQKQSDGSYLRVDRNWKKDKDGNWAPVAPSQKS